MSGPHQLLTVTDRVMLLVNALNAGDPVPVCRLIALGARSAWTVVSIDPGDLDRLFGLCESDAGTPEVGYFSVSAISRVAEKDGCHLLRDEQFHPDKPFSAYVDDARAAQQNQA